MKLFGIYGAGGCGRGIMPLAREQLQAEPEFELVFVDDHVAGTSINGHRTLSFDQFVAEPSAERHIALAVAESRLRADLASKCSAANLHFFSVWARKTVRMDSVGIGEGALISPFVTLTSNIRIGVHFQANIYSYVEHDCVIGDFVTFAPRVACNGNIHIDDHAYIGTGAVIRQGRLDAPVRIGEGAVVGMGAVVTKDVPPGVTVIGNPARPLKR
jgi:sugar O-acyltransferase (sialic acid O-acetyltransferase NeuD family)